MAEAPGRAFVQRYWPTLILASTGVSALIAGLAQSPARGGFAGELAGLGVFTLILSAFAPRLTEWEIGPKGVKGKLTEQRQAEESSMLMSEPALLDADESLGADDLVIAARTALAGDAIATLLQPDSDGDLAGCLLRLYLYDEEDALLVPVIRHGDPEPSEVERFRPGCGATGTAFAKGRRSSSPDRLSLMRLTG